MTTKSKTAGKTATKKAAKKSVAKKTIVKKDEPKTDKPVAEKEKQVQERDTKQFLFNGEKLGKGPFVLAAVRHYVKHHPKVSLTDLKKVFPDTLISRYGVFTDLKTALDKSKTSGKKRYFINDDQVFEVGGKKYAVTNQITAQIMEKFLSHLKEQGMNVK